MDRRAAGRARGARAIRHGR